MLEASLVLVFLAFCAIMGSVLMFCIRARKRAQAADMAQGSDAAVASDDERILLVLFGAILAGAALALVTGYLVFF
jgi:hypothetical protein